MEKEEQHISFKDQAVRYLANEMTVSEKEQFERSFKGDAEKIKELDALKKIMNGVDSIAARSKFNMDNEWSLLEKKIDFNKGENRSLSVIRLTFIRIAAVLILGILAVAGWYGGRQLLTYDKVAIDTGTVSIELPDGSMVTLNSGSVVRYSKNEISEERRVKLSGEAFFEVMRDTTRPFIIEAGPAQIKVLGTSFNVNAYPENRKVEVTVSSGLVALSAKGNEDHQILLNRGNTGTLDKKRDQLNLLIEGNQNANSWKTRVVKFTDTPLKEVIDVLSHTYYTEILILDDQLSEVKITVSFNNQELEAVLNVLSTTLDLDIRKEGSQVTIDSRK